MDHNTKINLVVDAVCLTAIVVNYFVCKYVFFRR